MTQPRLLLRKAIIRGGAATDLFSVTVPVKPHMQGGHLVHGYMAVRHKHPPAAASTSSPKVQLEGFAPGEHRLGQAAIELAHRLIPEHRVRVVINDRIPGQDSSLGLISSPHTSMVYGANQPVLPHGVKQDFTIEIARHLDQHGKARNEAEMLSSLLHEFGHALQMGRFFAQTPQEREPIVRQWLDETHAMDKGKPNLSDAKQWLLGNVVTPEDFEERLKHGPPMNNRLYFRVFEEWFAEKFVQWMADEVPPRSAIDRFFSGAIQQLRGAYHTARRILGMKDNKGPLEDYARRIWKEQDGVPVKSRAPPRFVVRRAALAA